MADGITFTDGSLGFYRTPEDAELWFDRTARAIRNYLSKSKAPKTLGPRIKDARDTFHFPLDEPPEAAIIGLSAHAAISELRRGNPETAEALSARALSDDPEWDTGKPPALKPLQRNWSKLVNGIAWIRHPRAELREAGYKIVRSVRRAAGRVLREKSDSHPDRDYWVYLHIMASNYALVGMAIRFDAKIRAGGTAQKWLMDHCHALLGEAKKTSFGYSTALVAWNNCQFAAMARDIGVFIDAMDHLFEYYGKDRILPMLEDDDDTLAMLKESRVATVIERA